MEFDRALLDIDFLVFSSHKTATQTVCTSLRMSGLKCLHCHSLADETTRLPPGRFRQYLHTYRAVRRRALGILSVFRDPVERHISSFFQWHGDGVIRKKLVADVSQTAIARLPLDQLQRMFIDEVTARRLTGMRESLDELCRESSVTASDLKFDAARQYGLTDLGDFRLTLFRFDTLMSENRLEHLLAEATGRSIVRHDANRTQSKWYYGIFTAFKESLRLPAETIAGMYEPKKHLIDLMYPYGYDSLLARACEKYGVRSSPAAAGAHNDTCSVLIESHHGSEQNLDGEAGRGHSPRLRGRVCRHRPRHGKLFQPPGCRRCPVATIDGGRGVHG